MARQGVSKEEAPKGRQDAPNSFGSLKEVANYLKSIGRPLSLSALKRRSLKGLLAKDASGRWSRASVDALAKTLLMEKQEPELDLPTLKLKRDIEKVEAQTRGIVFDNEVKRGRYLAKDEVYKELAHRIVTLNHGLKQRLSLEASAWIRQWVEEGRREDAVKAFKAMAERAIDAGLAETAKKFEEVELDVRIEHE